MSDKNKDGLDTDVNRFENKPSGQVQYLSLGIEAFRSEREKQIMEHNHSFVLDAKYTNEELKKAAMYLLTDDEKYFPDNWDTATKIKFFNKNPDQKLVIAGALLAAEYDRIINSCIETLLFVPRSKEDSKDFVKIFNEAGDVVVTPITPDAFNGSNNARSANFDEIGMYQAPEEKYGGFDKAIKDREVTPANREINITQPEYTGSVLIPEAWHDKNVGTLPMAQPSSLNVELSEEMKLRLDDAKKGKQDIHTAIGVPEGMLAGNQKDTPETKPGKKNQTKKK